MKRLPEELLRVAASLIRTRVLAAWLPPETVAGTWLAERSLPAIWGDTARATEALLAVDLDSVTWPSRVLLLRRHEAELGLRWSEALERVRREALEGAPSLASADEQRAFDLGAMTFGVPLALFAEWVADAVIAERVEVVACLLREGATFAPLVSRALAARGSHTRVVPFHASRRSTLCCAHREANDELFRSLTEHRSTPLAAIPELLGQGRVADGAMTRESLRAWYDAPSTRVSIAAWLEDQRAAFDAYSDATLGAAKRVAFVDVGMKGTIAARLTRALDDRFCTHLYWMAASETHRLARTGVDVRGFAAGPFHQVEEGRGYDRSSEVCEQLWMGDEGSTLAYARTTGGVAPLLGPAPSPETSVLRRSVRVGVLAAQEAFLAAPEGERAAVRADERRVAAHLVTRLQRHPTRDEAELVDRVGCEDNMGAEDRHPLLRRHALDGSPEAFLLANRLAFEHAGVRWPEGELAVVAPGALGRVLAERALITPDPRDDDRYAAALAARANRALPGDRVLVLGAGPVARALGEMLLERGVLVEAFVDAPAVLRGERALLGCPVVTDEAGAALRAPHFLVGSFAHAATLRERFSNALRAAAEDCMEIA